MNLEPIDTSTTAGKAEVMRLAADGRKVAGKSRSDEDDWFHVVEPTWNWVAACFAIIAEPVGPHEIWVVVTDNHAVESVWNTKRAAQETAKNLDLNVVRYVRSDQ